MATNISMKTTDRKDWATPQWLYDKLNAEFHFTRDLAATANNTKHEKYYSPEQDSLSKDWNGEVGYCNPPYGRDIGKWVKKASEILTGTVVMLLPARTDVKWFHEYIYPNHISQKRFNNNSVNCKIRFLRGRLKYDDGKVGAPFPSMIVIFKGIAE